MPTEGNVKPITGAFSRSGNCTALDYNELCAGRVEITGIESHFLNDVVMIVRQALSVTSPAHNQTV